ncbi:hypothetical protein ACFVXE_08960 [Streptomyces sp. NPDC058231]|uniref:hypothetical protein n=1 Tax=Streptomyces sp. NPDC058231 TaxID=3346392 RepID=UPI0036EEC8D5
MRACTMLETATRPDRLRRAEAFVASGFRSGAFQAAVDRAFVLDEIVEAHRYPASNARSARS